MARNGKVARLPFDVREDINRRLLDGEKAHVICAAVNKSQGLTGRAALTDNNISEWRKGGYEEWQKKSSRVEQIKRLSEFALRLAESAGSDLNAGAAAIAGGRILDVIESASDEDLSKLIQDLASLRHLDQNAQKLELEKIRLRQKDEALLIEKKKFQRTTCELFLKWFDEKSARDIAKSGLSNAEKIETLGKAMFGEDW